MSILDFGAGTHTNTTRYYSLTGPALPNSDWCIGVWFRNADISGTTYEYFVSQNGLGVANNVQLILGQASAGAPARSVWLNFQGTAGGADVAFGPADNFIPASNGLDYLAIGQRRGSNFEVYLVAEGATRTAADATAAVGTNTGCTSGTWNIGRRTDALRYFGNPMGEIFVYDNLSLTAAQVTSVAAGNRPGAFAGSNPLILWAFRDGEVATEPNIGTGGATYNAALNGTGFTTTTPDFFPIQQLAWISA